MLRFPVWLRALVAAVLFGLFMVAFTPRAGRDVWLTVLPFAVGACVYGAVMGVTMRRQDRRAFQAGGQPLSGPERVAVVRAVRNGEPPSDPRLREAAVGYAHRLLRPVNSVAAIAVMVAVFTALALTLAVADGGAGAWLLVVVWLVLGAVLVGRTRRQRRHARAYLSRSTAEPAGTPATRALGG